MIIRQMFQKAFIGGQWYVAYRRKGESTYKLIDVLDGMWIADPMMYEENGEHYLFVELYENKKKKAGIGYYHFENGIPVFKGMIIENTFHMSYPCVFAYNGIHYMIPESSANNTVSLYRAECFPDKWIYEKDLITGAKFVDSTVVNVDGHYYLMSYRKVKGGWRLIIFDLDMENKEIKEESSIFYKNNIARPAGYIFNQNKRPAQNCNRKYGENLIIYQIDCFNPYTEHKIGVLTPKQIEIDKSFDRVHTYTEDSTYEAVDLFKERFDLNHGINIFFRSHF